MARPAQGLASRAAPCTTTSYAWQCDGPLGRLHHALYEQAREMVGKEASPTTAIVDSQSVKGAEKGGTAD